MFFGLVGGPEHCGPSKYQWRWSRHFIRSDAAMDLTVEDVKSELDPWYMFTVVVMLYTSSGVEMNLGSMH